MIDITFLRITLDRPHSREENGDQNIKLFDELALFLEGRSETFTILSRKVVHLR